MAELRLPTPPLAGPGVLLRPWAQEDVDAIVAGFGDPSVLRFSWPHERPYTEVDAREYLVEQERARRLGGELHFAIASPELPSGVLGGGSLYDVDRVVDRRAGIGFWLVPEARGRGIATRAVRLCAGWAFRELGLERLELTCDPDNRAAQRVAERCGFRREARLRSHIPFQGGRRDSELFGLLRSSSDCCV